MFFQKLPERLKEAIKALTIDDVFKQRFGTDEVLNKLDEEKFDLVQSYNELCNSSGIPVVINGEAYNAVKLFQYVYLWNIDNSLIRDNKKAVTELDLDIFFYTLDNPITTTGVELAKKAVRRTKEKKP